jgi:SAM-dependent methyltransferase
MTFANSYDNAAYAEAYANLEFANTYHLAFRDLPEIYKLYVKGTTALDFGCGAGRSTRFLRRLGFDVIGVEISPEMVEKASEINLEGDYRVIPDDDMSSLPQAGFDLIQSAFTFDNIPGRETKARIFRDLRGLLAPEGVLVHIVSTPEIYCHEWASFTTRDFPENRQAKAGDVVRIITTEFKDRTPCLDILFPDQAYRELFAEVGLEVAEQRLPLATGDEPYPWISETEIAPWSIYVLRRSGMSKGLQARQ